jgi:Glycosyl transferases group 1
MTFAVPVTTSPAGVARNLRIAFLGNFQPGLPAGISPWSTETHLALSLESLGHQVVRLQEGEVRATDVPAAADGADLLVWVQTYGLAETGGSRQDRRWMLAELQRRGVPVLAPHLDRWWGLDREWQVREEPYFLADLVATADGGHDREWAAAGVNHVWNPPGVYHAEVYRGTPRAEYRADVAFVGGWRAYDHREWRPVRRAMIVALERRYGATDRGGRFACWPRAGEGQVRGTDLNDLYASVAVVVGDSCLAGGIRRYWSDRIPETLGRGGFLLHPYTPDVVEAFPMLPTWPMGDWGAMLAQVDYYLDHPEARRDVSRAAMEHIRENHTYQRRMDRLLRIMAARGLLRGRAIA